MRINATRQIAVVLVLLGLLNVATTQDQVTTGAQPRENLFTFNRRGASNLNPLRSPTPTPGSSTASTATSTPGAAQRAVARSNGSILIADTCSHPLKAYGR